MAQVLPGKTHDQSAKDQKKRDHHQINGEKSPSSLRATKKLKLQHERAQLPIWSHADSIRQGLKDFKDVLLLVGETGSGKSTQVPQFLLGEPWCKRCIAVTQPRRVAAISLARRVAEEMGTTLGSMSPASKVGYSVRFDNNTSPGTRIKYLTEGMLLQEMLRDPLLTQYSAVIVDEVHERSVNVDLILGFMRNLITRRREAPRADSIKVVVMSASADTEALSEFFEAGYPGLEADMPLWQDESVENGNFSDSSWSGISDDESKVTKADRKRRAGRQTDSKISTCYIEGRQYPIQTIYAPEPTQDFTETALQKIFEIHHKEPLPGDILVFLTGQDTVESLENLVNEYAAAMDPKVPKVSITRGVSLLNTADNPS